MKPLMLFALLLFIGNALLFSYLLSVTRLPDWQVLCEIALVVAFFVCSILGGFNDD